MIGVMIDFMIRWLGIRHSKWKDDRRVVSRIFARLPCFPGPRIKGLQQFVGNI